MNKKRSSRSNRRFLTGMIIFLSVVLVVLLVLVVYLERNYPSVQDTTEPTDVSTQGTQAGDPTDDTATVPIVLPTTLPTEESTEAPTAEPTTESTEEPSVTPTTKPAAKPTEPTEHVHRYTVTRVVKATCISGGYSVYTCKCGDSYKADKTPVSDSHDYFTVLIPPSTVAEGYTRHVCRDCGKEYRDNYTEKLPTPTTEPATEPTIEPTAEPSTTSPTTPSTAPSTEPDEDVMFNLVHGLQITDIGSYSGPFLEDGSGKTVENILMIQLHNNSGKDLQFATIELTGSRGKATFTVSTLPAGASVILLEQNAKSYNSGEFTVATAENVVFYEEKLSTQSNKIRLKGLDGALNVTNISGEPISGNIEIYYKNYIDGQLYGGITYVARVTGGLTDGETRQIMTGHFSVVQSIIMFVKIVE